MIGNFNFLRRWATLFAVTVLLIGMLKIWQIAAILSANTFKQLAVIVIVGACIYFLYLIKLTT